jgi:uncharacterized paraquat-inducible protein A
MIFAKIDNRLIIIVIKNQCPFCGKSLRVVPINSEEYCPHCGCKIEQEHKKTPVDIALILGNLITVIFDYQILRKPLKILSL